ncbi:DUF1499 domain-containing protein [Brucella pseudogrignonensis]|uniref:DUF1499 domain-containing protein n=1 Tax=Brucella pseudogrignonensis TaxID=419475 RepID=UPI00190C0AA6|nr:DUF1499 domain-containing protein [Brucella pseudogrignonensis]MBK0020507.1 DUF1499 domain-containing protein [Ochrobactrum sp. S45]MBK0042753.1 DUF1499 domain-containing protein [Ochrobactrum sp. S46]UKK91776.1 DUF1499 domain-containing protein [Brucella pseudogrignonensis]
MRKLRYQRRQSRSAIWALRFGVFAAVLSALGLILHRFGKIETPDFVLVATAGGIFAILALLCAAKGLRNLWVNGDKGGARSFWASFLACAVLLPLCFVASLWYGSPPLYDLTTDFETPPQFPSTMPARLTRMNSLPVEVQSDMLRQMSAYPDVMGRRYEAAPDRVAQGVENTLKAFGWKQISRDTPLPTQNATRFAATAHSTILGLKSDVVIRLLDEGETTYVDMRSVSRYGTRDMGLNAGFITEFLSALEGEVNKAPADVE